jgi:Amt family ammonium transporter
LLKNLFNICLGSIGFWLVGYAFAFSRVHGFIGFDAKLAASNGFEDLKEDNYLNFVFHVAFALTSSTIVLGALAERTKLRCYIAYSFIHTSFVYPVVIGWTQDEGGWLYDLGYYDFAGTSTVFLVGGTAGLIGTALLGERYGRDKVRNAMKDREEDRERALRASAILFEDNRKFEKVISKVNVEYHEAFKEWLLS